PPVVAAFFTGDGRGCVRDVVAAARGRLVQGGGDREPRWPGAGPAPRGRGPPADRRRPERRPSGARWPSPGTRGERETPNRPGERCRARGSALRWLAGRPP